MTKSIEASDASYTPDDKLYQEVNLRVQQILQSDAEFYFVYDWLGGGISPILNWLKERYDSVVVEVMAISEDADKGRVYKCTVTDEEVRVFYGGTINEAVCKAIMCTHVVRSLKSCLKEEVK